MPEPDWGGGQFEDYLTGLERDEQETADYLSENAWQGQPLYSDWWDVPAAQPGPALPSADYGNYPSYEFPTAEPWQPAVEAQPRFTAGEYAEPFNQAVQQTAGLAFQIPQFLANPAMGIAAGVEATGIPGTIREKIAENIPGYKTVYNLPLEAMRYGNLFPYLIGGAQRESKLQEQALSTLPSEESELLKEAGRQAYYSQGFGYTEPPAYAPAQQKYQQALSEVKAQQPQETLQESLTKSVETYEKETPFAAQVGLSLLDPINYLAGWGIGKAAGLFKNAPRLSAVKNAYKAAGMEDAAASVEKVVKGIGLDSPEATQFLDVQRFWIPTKKTAGDLLNATKEQADLYAHKVPKFDTPTARFDLFKSTPRQILNKVKSMGPLEPTPQAKAYRLAGDVNALWDYLASKSNKSADQLAYYVENMVSNPSKLSELGSMVDSEPAKWMQALLRNTKGDDLANFAAQYFEEGGRAKVYSEMKNRADVLFPAPALDPEQRLMANIQGAMTKTVLGPNPAFPAVNLINGIEDTVLKGRGLPKAKAAMDAWDQRVMRGQAWRETQGIGPGEVGVTPQSRAGIASPMEAQLKVRPDNELLPIKMLRDIKESPLKFGTKWAQEAESFLSRANFQNGFDNFFHKLWKRDVAIPTDLPPQLTSTEKASFLARVEGQYHYDEIQKAADDLFGPLGKAPGSQQPYGAPKPRAPHQDPDLNGLRDIDPDTARAVQSALDDPKTQKYGTLVHRVNQIKNELKQRLNKVRAQEPPEMQKAALDEEVRLLGEDPKKLTEAQKTNLVRQAEVRREGGFPDEDVWVSGKRGAGVIPNEPIPEPRVTSVYTIDDVRKAASDKGIATIGVEETKGGQAPGAPADRHLVSALNKTIKEKGLEFEAFKDATDIAKRADDALRVLDEYPQGGWTKAGSAARIEPKTVEASKSQGIPLMPSGPDIDKPYTSARKVDVDLAQAEQAQAARLDWLSSEEKLRAKASQTGMTPEYMRELGEQNVRTNQPIIDELKRFQQTDTYRQWKASETTRAAEVRQSTKWKNIGESPQPAPLKEAKQQAAAAAPVYPSGMPTGEIGDKLKDMARRLDELKNQQVEAQQAGRTLSARMFGQQIEKLSGDYSDLYKKAQGLEPGRTPAKFSKLSPQGEQQLVTQPQYRGELEARIAAEQAKGKTGKTGGFTPTQEKFLSEQLKGVEGEKAIPVPGDGTVTVHGKAQAEHLQQILSGELKFKPLPRKEWGSGQFNQAGSGKYVKGKPQAEGTVGPGTYAPGEAPRMSYARGLDMKTKAIFKELDNILAWEKENWGKAPVIAQDMDKRTALELWMKQRQLEQKLLQVRTAAAKAGEATRDTVLHDYIGGRLNADTLLSRVFPYHFWVTREGATYAGFLMRNPEFISFYMRLQQVMDEANKDLPESWKDTVRIPFTDERINPELFANPIYRYAQFMDEAKTALPKAGESLAQGDVGKAVAETALPGFKLLSPVPGVEAGVRGALGEESLAQQTGRMGAFAPVNRALQGVTAMAKDRGIPGSQYIPAGGANPEDALYGAINALTKGTPVEQNLSTRQQYEPTYVGRALWDMAQKGEISQEEYDQAMKAQSGPIWDKGLTRANAIRGETDVTGFFTGMRPRQVQASELEIDQAKQAYAKVRQLVDAQEQLGMKLIDPNTLYDAFHTKHPFYRGWQMRYAPEAARKESYDTSQFFQGKEQLSAQTQAQVAAARAGVPIGGNVDLDAIYERQRGGEEQLRTQFPMAKTAPGFKTGPEAIEQDQQTALRVVDALEPKWGPQWGGNWEAFQYAHDQWERDPNAVLAQYYRGNPDRPSVTLAPQQVKEYGQRYHSADQALDRAYSAWNSQRIAEGQSSQVGYEDEREAKIARRVIEDRFGEQPDAEWLAGWVKREYGDRFPDLAERIQARGITTLEEREKPTDAKKLYDAIYDELGKRPSTVSSDWHKEAINAEMAKLGHRGKDYMQLFYDSGGKGLKKPELDDLYQVARKVAGGWKAKDVATMQKELQESRLFEQMKAEMDAATQGLTGKAKALAQRRIEDKYGRPLYTDKLQAEGDALISRGYDELAKVPPGKSDEYWDLVAKLAGKELESQAKAQGKKWFGLTGQSIQDIWYNTDPTTLGDKLGPVIAAMEKAGAQLGYRVPSVAALTEWVQAEKDIAEYMAMPKETREEKAARRAYWDAHPLLAKYYSSDETKPTQQQVSTPRPGYGGGGYARGGYSGGTPRAPEPEGPLTWAMVPGDLAEALMSYWGGQGISRAMTAKLLALYRKYAAKMGYQGDIFVFAEMLKKIAGFAPEQPPIKIPAGEVGVPLKPDVRIPAGEVGVPV